VPGELRNAPRTRREVLDAAARALVAHGPSVSLDAVAKEAGVSKGGLLHHFRTKQALLAGLIGLTRIPGIAEIQEAQNAQQLHVG